MAPLYGRLKGSRGEATRTEYRRIESVLETWEGEIETVLLKNGDFLVYVGENDQNLGETPIYEGNLNEYLEAFSPSNESAEAVVSKQANPASIATNARTECGYVILDVSPDKCGGHGLVGGWIRNVINPTTAYLSHTTPRPVRGFWVALRGHQ